MSPDTAERRAAFDEGRALSADRRRIQEASVLRLHRMGQSPHAISKAVRLSAETVRKVLRAHGLIGGEE